MNKGQVEYAEERAKHFFHEWNDVTGVFMPGTSYFAEVEACIIDAVHVGIQVALYGNVEIDENEQIIKQREDCLFYEDSFSRKYDVLRDQVIWAVNHYNVINTNGIIQHLKNTLESIGVA